MRVSTVFMAVVGTMTIVAFLGSAAMSQGSSVSDEDLFEHYIRAGLDNDAVPIGAGASANVFGGPGNDRLTGGGGAVPRVG